MSTVYFRKSFQRAFGTYPLKGDACIEALEFAAGAGYCAIDTAQMYGNEADVGAALASIGRPRDEWLITTKVRPENFAESQFIASVEQSLKDLRVDIVDVLLLHWPPGDGDRTIAPVVVRRSRGLARHVGVSNYTSAMLRRISSVIDDPIVTNQVEFHPLLNQDVLLAAAAETGIPLASYCSVARGEVFKYPLFQELAANYEKSPAQIVLRWILQKGVSVNTMSTKEANIQANFDVMNFTLSSVDMARIDAMTKTGFRIVNADLVPWAPDWD